MLVGGFFDRHHAQWNDDEIANFEMLLEEQDVDIMAWAIGTAEPPARYRDEIIGALKTLNYIKHPE